MLTCAGRADDALRLLVPVPGIDGDASAHELLLPVVGNAQLDAALLVLAADVSAVIDEFNGRYFHSELFCITFVYYMRLMFVLFL